MITTQFPETNLVSHRTGMLQEGEKGMPRGMQQKMAIARALLSKPRPLLLDEPTTGLDSRSKRELWAIVQELNREYGTTILLATHHMVEADILYGPAWRSSKAARSSPSIRPKY